MRHENGHITDEDLLLSADGELSSRRKAAIDSHLEACWACRTRMKEIDTAIADFVHSYSELEARLPPIDGPRALLRARLAQLAAESRPNSLEQARQFVFRPRRLAFVTAAFIAVVCGAFLQFSILPVGAASVPAADLTPGSALNVSLQEICSTNEEEALRKVSPSLADEVFKQYGIRDPQPRAYELDYLITPALGGASDIRNLWPQPYSTGTWNSRVKDALEDHLHRLVCEGRLDLATAQREISANWIDAYKKYFQRDEPLPSHSEFAKDPPWE